MAGSTPSTPAQMTTTANSPIPGTQTHPVVNLDTLISTIRSDFSDLTTALGKDAQQFFSHGGPTTTNTGDPYTFDGPLIFPADLEKNNANNVYMSFTWYTYQRRSILQQPFLQQGPGAIVLPPPQQMIDRAGVDFTQANNKDNPAVGAAIENTIQNGNNIGSLLAQAPTFAAAQGGIGLANKLARDVFGISEASAQALQFGGYAQNPFLTVLFNSPIFKRYTFSWKLAPNTESESNTLYKITNSFRWNMLPSRSQYLGGTLLTYPNMVVPSFSPNSTFTYKFKPCVVEWLDLNFSPGTTPAFFNSQSSTNQKPVVVQFSISLLEIEYWLQPDVVLAYPPNAT